MSQQENKVQKEIQDYLESIGAYRFKVHGEIFMRAGIPDIIACLNGRFIGIEVKDGNNKPSELQLAHGRQIKKSGGIFGVAYSVEDVKKLLRENNLAFIVSISK